MLVTAAVCPHPPALVPAVSQGGAALLDEVRTAAVRAVRDLVAVPHDALVCVGVGSGTTCWPREAGGTMRRFGVDVLSGGSSLALPLSLTVAAYLLGEAEAPPADRYQEIAADALPEACRRLGEEIGGCADRVALLVMGDGSAKRTEHSPGYFDARADAFDAAVVRALGMADPAALVELDPTLCEELWVAGRPAWQVLAGALESTRSPMTGAVRYDDAPLGVGYFVVVLGAAETRNGS